MNTRAKNQSGFSLIELIIVVAIIGIMATIAIPSVRGMMQRAKLKAAGREITMELLLARSQAISTGTSKTVIFNVGAGTWVVPDKGTFGFTQGNYHGIVFSHSSSDPIQFKSSAGASVDSVTFKSDGTLDNDLSSYTNAFGKIYLLDTKTNLNNKLTIEVNQYTGLARMKEGWSTL
ncbi:MAG: prepilin-type N-terminal cleavage/methylation domain-containing protein [bacterium]|nr:prepilin-type N-terminal cleavage/methylation domain-containing protein [bacterium]